MHTQIESAVKVSAPLGAGALADQQIAAAIQISEWLTFKLGDVEYAMDILRVQEIRSYEVPTRIANAPANLQGVINLRGVIVPIVDMRINFGLDSAACDASTVVIVLNLGTQVVGMVIDAVSDVITLTPEQIKAAPCLAQRVQTHHLLGIGSVDERTLMLVDIAQLLRSDQVGLFSSTLQ